MNFQVIFFFAIIALAYCSHHITSALAQGLGAGVGAGVGIAGTEAVIHHFTKKEDNSGDQKSAPASAPSSAPPAPVQETSASSSTQASPLDKCVRRVLRNCEDGGECDISDCVKKFYNSPSLE